MSVLRLKAKNVLNSKGSNIVEQDSIAVKLNKINSRNALTNLSYGNSAENINSGICISKDNDKIYAASSSLNSTECIGICFKSCGKGEKICYVTSGIVQNNTYIFSAPYGRPIWVNSTGMPTDFPPTNGSYLQIIGYSIDENTFFFTPNAKILKTPSGFKSKASIPVINQILQSTSSDNYPQGTMLLGDGALVSTDINIMSHTQSSQSAEWIVPLSGGVNIGNIETIIAVNGAYMKVLPDSVSVSNNSIVITFSQDYIGIVTYCILH